jgi:hypothetical protein
VQQTALPQNYEYEVTDKEGNAERHTVQAHSMNAALKAAQKLHPDAAEVSVGLGQPIPNEGGYQVPGGKPRATPNSKYYTEAADKAKSIRDTMYHELGHYMIGHNEGHESRGMFTSSHPEMPRQANAAVSWKTDTIMDPTTGRMRPEKAPGVYRMLMGGVAADEIFSGLDRKNNGNFEVGNSITDGTLLNRFLRAEGHPDADIPGLMNQYVDAAKEYLTKPHVRGVIDENVGNREPNLSTQFHYSPERLKAMGDEAARRGAQNEETHDNAGVSGVGNQNGGGNVAGREGEAARAGDEGTAAEAVEQSNLSKDKAKDVLDAITAKYGTSDSVEPLRHEHSFILPDGKLVHLEGMAHNEAIAANGGGGSHEGNGWDNRPEFINKSGAVRAHGYENRSGHNLTFSVPKDGVTAEQADTMNRAASQGYLRNGTLNVERADLKAETKDQLSKQKSFPRAGDVHQMLREIGAHPDMTEQSNLTKTDPQIEEHEKNGGSTFTPYGENLAGKDLHAVGAYPERTMQVDKLTPEVLNDFKTKNQDVLSQPNHAVGTWKDPDTGKTVLDVSKTIADRDEAIAAGKAANQKAIYHLGSGETIPTGGTGENIEPTEQSNLAKSPKGSTVPLMTKPLEAEGTGEKGKISTLDVAKALNEHSQSQNPALAPGSEPKEMVARARKIAEDEAKYQLAQGKTGTEWYTEEMKDHDKALQGMRPELNDPVKLSLFKAAEAVLSSGQKPYGNFKSAVKAWDAYHETGEFPRLNPATGKSWGPRGEAAYGNALDMINKLVAEKGEKGASEWLLADHPVSELKEYNTGVKGKKTDTVPGAMILGAKRGPFMQNLHGIESAFTADMWVSRTWNRWMGTIETGLDKDGNEKIKSDSPRNGAERDLMKQSFEHTAKKLGLTTSSLQAVLWYYEQSLYSKQGIPKESWSFKDAAERAAKEEGAKAPQQEGFNFGANETPQEKGFKSVLGGLKPLPSNFVK